MAKQFDLETQSWTEVIDVHEPDEVLPEIDAHGYLIGVYRGTIKPNSSRLRAAIACLKYEVVDATERDLAERLEDRMKQALVASDKVIDGRASQMIEPPKPAPVSEPVQVDPPDHSGPFAQNSKHRFRTL